MSDIVTIRQATANDADVVMALINDLIRTTTVTFTSDLKTVDGIAAEIALRGPAFLVAERNATVVGYASYFPFRAGPGYAATQEHSILLDSSAHGRGIGRALMERLETVAAEAGVHSLMAGVSGENTAGIAFHASLGFEIVGRLPEVGCKFDRWLDLVLMQKRL